MKFKKTLFVAMALALFCVGGACEDKKGPEVETPGSDSKESVKPYIPPKIEVKFADAELERLVRDQAGKPGGALYVSDLMGVARLDLRKMNITDLSGLDKITTLRFLDLGGNFLRDVSPLAGLRNLEELRLDNNFIVDIGPVGALKKLKKLDLSINEIEDIGPLAGLKELEHLNLSDNLIGDITPLAGLARLDSLDIGKNKVTDLAPLAQNALAGGLGEGDTLNVSGNPLSAATKKSAVVELKEMGVVFAR